MPQLMRECDALPPGDPAHADAQRHNRPPRSAGRVVAHGDEHAERKQRSLQGQMQAHEPAKAGCRCALGSG